jgi:hypothetical protein
VLEDRELDRIPRPILGDSLPRALRARSSLGGRTESHDRTAQVSIALTLTNGFHGCRALEPAPSCDPVNETAGVAAGSGSRRRDPFGRRCWAVSSNAAEIGQVTGKSDSIGQPSDAYRSEIGQGADQAESAKCGGFPRLPAGWRGHGPDSAAANRPAGGADELC